MSKLHLVLSLALAGILPITAIAQVPDSISFQGRLLDSIGDPLDDTVDITTTFYKGGIAGYTQVHGSVVVTDGLFNLTIGPVDTVDFSNPIEVGVKVGTDPELAPRTPLQSVPFALGTRGHRAIQEQAGLSIAHSVTGGSPNNSVAPGVVGGTISGGGGTSSGNDVSNSVTDHWSTIGGGSSNSITENWGTIGGGDKNVVSGIGATIGGGRQNVASVNEATVAGGFRDTASFNYAAVAGGIDNRAHGTAATVAGGELNRAMSDWAAIGGGYDNDITGDYAAVVGGYGNLASGFYSTVVGGEANTASGSHSVAMGKNAQALHNNSFVFNAAFGPDTLQTTGTHQFMAKAKGGVWFYSSVDTSMGVRLTPNAGSWVSVSSAEVKTAFESVDGQRVLQSLAEVPIRTWRYRLEDENIRHMGPTSEEFFEAFGLGPTTRGIMTVDADGVALAAIQGLHEIVREQQAEIERLRRIVEER